MNAKEMIHKAAWILIDEKGRPRSGVRVGIFVAVFVFGAGLLGVAAASMMGAIGISGPPGTKASLFLNGALTLSAALFAGWLCVRYLEFLPFRSLGAWFTARWAKHLAAGLIIGAATLCIGVAIAAAFGGLTFEVNASFGACEIIRTLLISSAVFLSAAAAEEAIFRGYILQTFARSGLAWFAIILTAALFGAVHLGNPNSGPLSSLNTAIAGIWFGVAYLKTRDLWFVTGLHMMWNWTQGAFFGIEVSGLKEIVSVPLLREIDRGPVWLTGGEYGLEGGIAATLALLISTAAIYKMPNLKPDQELLAMTSTEPPPRIEQA
jgi:uncharacterized protein